ncbi:CoA pyrophosphatase [Bacillus sp. 31A1R]|uniref:CoA pyrophosphatase n=1 Tax=Robertmurraya mangrovi TaxID=3098077 RepID=A0ABU5J3L5_9BACI|nr:CoA pyrophosphatase [Bacillus sp. 31A1R]MDZ5473994.1 CoA pyrophosphatase [Bacillus sp. 31A1R]
MEIGNIVSKINTRAPKILGSEGFTKFSVLVPLVEINQEPHILFEVRSLKLRRQPGEICFPGGRLDKSDRDEQHTAVRETSEELGIKEQSIRDILPLDYMVSPFGTIIYPYIGVIEKEHSIIPNKDEVEEIFTIPLSVLKTMKPDVHFINFKIEPNQGFPYELISGGEDYNWQTRQMEEYFYYYEDRVIWGLTAKILKHFLERINS